MNDELKSRLRSVVLALNDEITDYVQDRALSVHEGIKVGTTTLDQITYLKGKADGAAELWFYLTTLSESDSAE